MRRTLERILQQGGRMKMGKHTFYFLERNRYPEQYNTKLTWNECVKIHSKLRRHYKLQTGYGFYWNKIEYNKRICGRAYGSGKIELGKNGLNIGVLSHEIAHLIAYKKHKHMRHDKKLWNIMKRVMNYTKKKNYWKKEVEGGESTQNPPPTNTLSTIEI